MKHDRTVSLSASNGTYWATKTVKSRKRSTLFGTSTIVAADFVFFLHAGCTDGCLLFIYNVHVITPAEVKKEKMDRTVEGRGSVRVQLEPEAWTVHIGDMHKAKISSQ